MSTITTAFRVFETARRNRRELLSATAAIDDVKSITTNRVKLLKGEQLDIAPTRFFVCSVNTPILIQLEKDGGLVQFELASTFSIPTAANIRLSNPVDNSIELPAIVTFISI